jgi:kynurenine formamidase
MTEEKPRMAPSGSVDAVTREQIETWFRELSNWGRWGADDELGALNLITPQKRIAAAALVREGASVSLARDAIKQRMGVSAPFEHTMVSWGATQGAEGASDIFSVQFHGYTQTHLDALCHIFHKGAMFNGVPQQSVSAAGAERMSVVAMKDGIVTRGVLMDMPPVLNRPYLLPDDAIGPQHLDACLERSGVRPASGDALILRTGRWAREAAEGPWDIEAGSAGLHASCLPWLKAHDIAVLVTDLAADLLPSRVAGVRMPIHLVTIGALGVPIIDNCDLEPLSRYADTHRRREFLFFASPLAVPGGTGSPINPVAMF